jgi:hypothetical protein
MSAFKHLPIVQEYLEKYPKLRDDDDRLVANIWHKVLCSMDLIPKEITAAKFLKLLSESELPSASSIKRCRRKLQEHNEELRGVLWELKHKKAEETAKEAVELKET